MLSGSRPFIWSYNFITLNDLGPGFIPPNKTQRNSHFLVFNLHQSNPVRKSFITSPFTIHQIRFFLHVSVSLFFSFFLFFSSLMFSLSPWLYIFSIYLFAAKKDTEELMKTLNYKEADNFIRIGTHTHTHIMDYWGLTYMWVFRSLSLNL